MSGSTGDPAADLLASLRANSAHPLSTTPTNRQSYPFASGAVKSPEFPNTHVKSPPVPPSSTKPEKMNRNTTPDPQAPPDLLQLLKFGQPSSSSSPQPAAQQARAVSSAKPEQSRHSTGSVHGRGVSASDLVSSIMGGKLSTPPPRERAATPSASTHQNSLLKLLNQTASGSQSPQQSNPASEAHRLSHDLAQTSLEDKQSLRSSVSPARKQSPIHYFGSKENSPLPFDPQAVAKGSPLHPSGSQTYINPFEQEEAATTSSKVNPPPSSKKQRLAPNGEASKRRNKSPSPSKDRPASRNMLTASGDDVLESIEQPMIDPRKDGRSRVEALIGIGAPSRNTETVARALNEVGNQVDRQVSNALAEAEKKDTVIKHERDDSPGKVEMKKIGEHVQDAANWLKNKFDQVENQEHPTAEAAQRTINAAAEQADDKIATADSSNQTLARRIKVHQFPMKPFVSIDLLEKAKPDLTLREQSDFPVARFKKEFDQADRALATATRDFIAYAVPKTNGGVRIIEQDSGTSSLIFPDTQDRVFNVAISTAAGTSTYYPQTVIATGVSGTVYWTTISEADTQLTQEEMQIGSLHFPPNPAGSDSTSGGQLKTRAKKSSRHPQFFAVGRGKSIQIVFPAHAKTSEFRKNSIVDTEKYFAARSLKIVTGKAGKDFTFSEDDTTIATLDKAGKLRLWDIRELIDNENATASRLASNEVKSPLLTFATAYSTEKSWPTSVLFVDKLRPYTKGTALRYIIVGMKQNHTLQLWDLCLGKAVQEVNFSHEKETDAICSVAYHPGTGVIVVGHPTRNSIYFIHLSAPKYNLPNVSQAKFAQRLADKDPSLPKAEATAIMSGMREYSLADKGQLRSVEITYDTRESSGAADGDEEPSLFELIVMHSKGVLCLGVKKEDLGWSKENRVLVPVNAEKEGLILVKELREPATTHSSEPSLLSASANGENQVSSSPTKGLSKTSSKDNLKVDRADIAPPNKDTEKKKSKKSATSETVARATASSSAPESYASAAQKGQVTKSLAAQDTSAELNRPNLSKHTSRDAPEAVASSEDRQSRSLQNQDSVSVGISGDFLNKEIKKIEQGVSNEFSKVLAKELGSLYKQLADERRVQDAAGATKQDTLLRVVSSTLSDNTEKSLNRIIQKSVQETVLPSIESTTTAYLNKQFSAVIGQQVQSTMPSAVKQSLSDSVNRALQSPETVRIISEQVSKAIAGHVEREISDSLNKIITPTFQNLALSISQKISGETERRVRDQLQQVEAQRRSDSAKIDQLSTLVSGLSEMVHTMASAQSQFQEEILKFQQKAAESGFREAAKDNHGHSPTPSESASMHASPEQEELDSMTTTMNQGKFEDATIMWLQSSQQVALFDNLFVRYDPSYLKHSSPLVILSVAAAVTASMETNIHERLAWLETALKAISPNEPETRDIGGRIIDVLTQRLESEYMRIAETNSSNSALRKIAALTKQAKDLRRSFPQNI